MHEMKAERLKPGVADAFSGVSVSNEANRDPRLSSVDMKRLHRTEQRTGSMLHVLY